MGEATKSMILFTDQILGDVCDAQDRIDRGLLAMAEAAVEVSKRNELLLEKLEDSNEKYAGLLAVQTAVLERNWAAASWHAERSGIDEQHLLRDLRWALERILEVAQADSYVAVRARIIAGRFSIPLMISMGECLATVEDYEEAFESDVEAPGDGLIDFTFELVEEASEPDMDELAEEVAAELREDEEFYQTFAAAIDAALKRLSPETRRDWELALGRRG